MENTFKILDGSWGKGYDGPYNFKGGLGKYIHVHRENIGLANKGQAVTEKQLVEIFNSYKKIAYKASKKNFNAILKLNLDNKSKKIIESASNPDILIKNIMDSLMNEVQNINVSDIQSLIQKQSKINYSNIVNLKNVTDLSNVLELIEEISNKIEKNNSFSQLLRTLINKNYKKTITLSNNTIAKIESYIKNDKIFSMEPLEIQNAAKYLLTACKHISNSEVWYNERGEKIKNKTKSLQTSIGNNIFSSLLQEALAQKATDMAFGSATKFMGEAVKGKGQEQTKKIRYDDHYGYKTSGSSQYGKADVQEKNIKIQVAEFKNDIKINLGISVKSYSSIANNKNQIVNFGEGVRMGEAIRHTFHNQRLQYLAYNTVAWGAEERSKSLGALNDVILLRNIVPLIASRGISDMAQFIMINGEIISVLDLINYAAINDNSGSLSVGGNTSGIALSLTGRTSFTENTLNISQNKRIKKLNAAIETMKISAQIHLMKLLKGMK